MSLQYLLTLLHIPCSHYDFISLKCSSGFADNVHAYLEVQGLEVADVERVGPPEARNPKTPKKWVSMTVSTAMVTPAYIVI
jgi:hypothetical protein